MQGKAPKEIHAILTEILACFLPGRAKDLPAPLYSLGEATKILVKPRDRESNAETSGFEAMLSNQRRHLVIPNKKKANVNLVIVVPT